MGWVADLLQELPVSAALKIKLEKIEAEHEKLKVELQQTQEQNAWLKAEVDRLKGQEQDRLNAVTEVLLKLIANNPGFVVGNLFDHMGLSRGELDHHIDLLRDRDFIFLASTGQRGARYNATPTGRKYLVDNQLL